MDNFLGIRYTLDNNEDVNVGALLSSIGVSAVKRIILTTASVTQVWTKSEDNTYCFQQFSSVLVMNFNVHYKLDEPCVYTRGDGTVVNAIFTVDGNTLTEVYDGNTKIVIREFSDEILKTTIHFGNSHVCSRIYRAEGVSI